RLWSDLKVHRPQSLARSGGAQTSRSARTSKPGRADLEVCAPLPRPSSEANFSNLWPMKSNINPIPVPLILLSAFGLISTLALARAAATNESPAYTFKLDSRASLLRVGAAPMEVTADALEAAEIVMDAIERKNVARAEEAIRF